MEGRCGPERDDPFDLLLPAEDHELGVGEAVAPLVDELELAATAGTSAIAWLPSRHPKVPVEVAATGPRVISAAARHADRVLLALGADPDRVRWGIETARESRRRAELDDVAAVALDLTQALG